MRTGRALTALLLILLCLSPALLASCGGQQSPTPAFSPEKVAALDQALDDFMAADLFPGLVVGIWAPGEGAYIATRGLASTDPERAMSDTDRSSIGSCTKEFIATLILQLVEEGSEPGRPAVRVLPPGAQRGPDHRAHAANPHQRLPGARRQPEVRRDPGAGPLEGVDPR